MQTPPTQDEQFAQIGKRLAFLLSSVNMPDDVKASWAELVPQMTLEQMDAFANALEENLVGVTTPELKQLSDSIQLLKARRDEEERSAIAKADQSLDEIEKLLQASE